MLNKCVDAGWFVVELCESMRAHRIELANFELYSSVPNDIRISLASTYPSTEWGLFGSFKAEDMRGIQTFINNDGVFGKYVRVEVLSHHGTEHYCPISMFKIYGISELELIGQDDDEEVANHFNQHPTETPTESPQGSSIVNIIKDSVDKTIGRMVGVFTAKQQVEEVAHDPLGTTLNFSPICPNCDESKVKDVNLFLASDFSDLRMTLTSNPALEEILKSGFCHGLGFEMFEPKHNISLSKGHNFVTFFRTLFGTSRLIALCNAIAWQEGKIKSLVPETSDGPNVVKETVENAPEFVSFPEPTKVVTEPTLSTNDTESKPVVVETAIPSSTTAAVHDSDGIVPTPVNTDTIESPSEVLSTPETEDKSKQDLDEPPSVVLVPPSGTAHLHTTTVPVPSTETPSPPEIPKVAVNQPGQRDSVWLKLSNRIKVSSFRSSANCIPKEPVYFRP